ncbi:oligosaccharide flippase family protein [Carboxylicivirga linearis]|uniref:Oligosaccharide flippase family protein n=1 Tax=Carboxylicivirga linearis TaxID=1628157 RepID=A0ABS5JW34_9BACT|nr:oligosaccharide flippase family protein [Carboxylicivirga linearis]MBS2099104.1 oligosaccharide flippase family protein [Carboxylicivirga linearis]
MINRKQILVENTLWVYLAKIVMQLISLIASVLVLRQLDVDVYGTYVFLFGLFTAYQLLITSPLKHVLTRFVPELRNKVAPSSLLKLVMMYVVIALVMVIVLTGLGVAFKDSLSQLFNIDTLDAHFKAFLFFVFSYSIKILLEVLLSALLLHRRIAILNMVLALCRALAYIILLERLNVNLLLLIEGCVSLIYSLPALFVFLNGVKKEDNGKELVTSRDKHRMQRFWLYSLFTELGAGLIGRTSDYYIVAAFSSPYFIGLYGFAVKIYELFYKVLPLKEFESVLKPLVFDRFNSTTDHHQLNSFYNFSIKVLLPVFILPFAYFLCFGEEVILLLFGAKYLDAYWPTVIILGGFITNGLFYPLSIFIHLKEKMHILLFSRLVVVFSLFAGIYMMKSYGISGVAIATIFGELIKNILMFFLFRSYVKIHYDRRVFISNLFLILTLIVFIYPLHLILSRWSLLVTGSILFSIIYLLFIINCHALRAKELAYLESIIQSNPKMAILYDKFWRLLNKLAIRKVHE